MNSVNTWNADLYDEKIGFVSEFGKSVVNLLKPKKDEMILDLGCETGDLSFEIAKSGVFVTGIDLSEQMVKKAKTKYSDIHFIVENAENFRTTQSFDAVFSNTVLHWMKNASNVVESIFLALRPGGRFVAELGGRGNVQPIIKGITDVMFAQYGIDVRERNPWYFPSVGEYSHLLENHGFHVIYAHHFDRPTQLDGGINGLKHWIDSFADDFLVDLSKSKQFETIEKLLNYLKSELYVNGSWSADYQRLRIMAIKKINLPRIL